MDFNERAKTLDLFRILTTRIYDDDTSKWLSESWDRLEIWHFELASHLNKNLVKQKFKILKLSLILQP